MDAGSDSEDFIHVETNTRRGSLDDTESLGVVSLDSEDPTSPMSAGARAVIEAAEEQQAQYDLLQDLLSSVMAGAHRAASLPASSEDLLATPDDAATAEVAAEATQHKDHSSNSGSGPATPHVGTATAETAPERGSEEPDEAELSRPNGHHTNIPAPAPAPALAPAPASSSGHGPWEASMHVLVLPLLLGATAAAIVAAVLLVAIGASGGGGAAGLHSSTVSPATSTAITTPSVRDQTRATQILQGASNPPTHASLSQEAAFPSAAAVEGFPELQEIWALALHSNSSAARINATLRRLARIAERKRAQQLQLQLTQLQLQQMQVQQLHQVQHAPQRRQFVEKIMGQRQRKQRSWDSILEDYGIIMSVNRSSAMAATTKPPQQAARSRTVVAHAAIQAAMRGSRKSTTCRTGPWANSTAATRKSNPAEITLALAGSSSSTTASAWRNSSLATCANIWARLLLESWPAQLLLQQLMLPAAVKLPMSAVKRKPAVLQYHNTSCPAAAVTASEAPAGPTRHLIVAPSKATNLTAAAGVAVPTAAASTGKVAAPVASKQATSVAALTAAAVVQSGSTVWRQIKKPVKPVPALYRPAPPCLVVHNKHMHQRAAVQQVSTSAKAVPALYRPAPPCLMVLPGHRTTSSSKGSTGPANNKAAEPASITTTTAAAAAVGGGGLTLPMLAPLVFAQPPVQDHGNGAGAAFPAGNHKAVLGGGAVAAAVAEGVDRDEDDQAAPGSGGSSSFGQFSLLQMRTINSKEDGPGSSDSLSANPSATAAAAAAGGGTGSGGGGLTLPMLPPVTGGVAEVSGGLTLPMLPPIICRSCGTHLQLLPPHSSKRLTPARPAARHPANTGKGFTSPATEQEQASLTASRSTTTARASGSRAMSPAVEPPTCPVPAASICPAQPQQLQQPSAKAGKRAAAGPTMPSTSRSVQKNATEAASGGYSTGSSSNKRNSSAANSMGVWVSSWASAPVLLPAPTQRQNKNVVAKGSTPVASSFVVEAQQKHMRDFGSSGSSSSSSSKHGPVNSAGFSATGSGAFAAKRLPQTATAVPGKKHQQRQLASARSADRSTIGGTTLQSQLHHLGKAADQLQRPVKQLMKLLNTASSRSLQCSPAPAPATAGGAAALSYHHMVAAAAAARRSGGGSAGGNRVLFSDAYAANSAAYAAAAELLAEAQALEAAANAAASAAAVRHCYHEGCTAQLAADARHKLQQQCWTVGLLHRSLQLKVAAAVFPATRSPGSSGMRAAAAFAAGGGGADHAAPSSRYNNQQQLASGAAIPLEPAGVLQPVLQTAPAAASLVGVPQQQKSLSVPATAGMGGLPGPLLPLHQQLAGSNHNNYGYHYVPSVPASSKRQLAGSKVATKVAGSSSHSSAKLNAGWDRYSAWQVARLAAEVGKAEGAVQKSCQQLLMPIKVVAVAV